MEDYYQRLLEILSTKLDIEISEINRDSKLYEDLRMDSLDKIECVMEIEYEFSIQINDEIAMKHKTIGEFYDYMFYLIKNKD